MYFFLVLRWKKDKTNSAVGRMLQYFNSAVNWLRVTWIIKSEVESVSAWGNCNYGTFLKWDFGELSCLWMKSKLCLMLQAVTSLSMLYPVTKVTKINWTNEAEYNSHSPCFVWQNSSAFNICYVIHVPPKNLSIRYPTTSLEKSRRKCNGLIF